MPELPEVETTRRGVAPHVVGRSITAVEVRQRRLRWPVPRSVDRLAGARVVELSRRAKYLLLDVGRSTVIMHLGMSGSLRLVDCGSRWRKHDHVAFTMDSGKQLRLHDPRRFGCVLLCKGDPGKHRLIRDLGPEPLSEDFDAAYLAGKASGKTVAIKQFVMNAHVVVGVGNIYASEALFISGIHPRRAAGKVGRARIEKLVCAIREVLSKSIEMGGTTLRDFVHEDGKPGYFKQSLRVYDREEEACINCGAAVKRIVQNSRSSFYCPRCQR
ncbi:MAG: bifunctional DNA-formamidopyrimidine glycosylase/DNA-(apurinic or apyrimidinic site) lyase [Verrucomicrobiaceae bacterium]|nr:bifunctional DNA-formamidopyrimidine glycosylase/DNA-(apurinic or apyrimidinic site) lyase [Verrucomicrobiaceae bacterium]